MPTTEDLRRLQRDCRKFYVDPPLIQYAVRLANATRAPKDYGLADLERYVTFGASPRASINLIVGARALAHMRGRDYVLAEDVLSLVPDVLRHRIVLSYEALSDEVTADQIVTKVLGRIAVPQQVLRSAKTA